MSWMAFSIVALATLAVQGGVGKHVLILEAQPLFVLPLVVFVALHAPPLHARWAAIALGLVLDLQGIEPAGAQALSSPTAIVVGPYVVGLLLTVQLAVAARGVVISRNPLTLVALTLLGGLIVATAVVAGLGLRSLYDGGVSLSLERLAIAMYASAVYSAVAALPMALALLGVSPFLRFEAAPGRRL